MENAHLLSQQELLSCLDLAQTLASELDSGKLFDVILKKLSELIPAANWSLLLQDHDTRELRFAITVDLEMGDLLRDVRLKPGEGVAGQVAMQQKPMVIHDVGICEYFTPAIDRITGFTTRSIICVPLLFGNQTLGVLEAINPHTLDDHTLALLNVIATYTAIAVENTRRFNEIRNLAIHDDLTGLYNTRYLYQALNDILARLGQSGEPFSLIFLDLDNFKEIVDTHGHLNGSLVIQEVGGLIRRSIADPAFGVSYGGDEFVIVLPGFDRSRAVARADELRETMANEVYLARQGINIRLTASFGVATHPEDARNITDLLALADKAMFRIKFMGKNAVG